MKLLFLLFFPTLVFGQVKSEGFVIQIHDRSISVLSPETKKNLFSVIVENKSLSNQVGKFIIGNKILKFVAVASGKAETVEIENKSPQNVTFVPVSPAFQEVPLEHGKKAYEVPSKK
jgi:hypothetical protein